MIHGVLACPETVLMLSSKVGSGTREDRCNCIVQLNSLSGSDFLPLVALGSFSLLFLLLNLFFMPFKGDVLLTKGGIGFVRGVLNCIYSVVLLTKKKRCA